MGKVIKDEDLKLNIIVNGKQGLKEIGELDNATRKLKDETKDLKAEKVKLIAAGKKESDEYKRVTTAIKENNAAVKANNEKLKSLKKQVGLTGLTMKQLRKEATLLRNQMDNAVPEGTAWKKYRAELKKVETRIAKVKGHATGIRGSLKKMAGGFNQYFGMIAAGSAALFGLIATGKELITGNAKLSDSYADVAKTTGLSIEEVKRLDKTMKQIDTRTSRAELLGLAEMAGKLGVKGAKNIEGFVKSADQINVSLGKDLGGSAEEAIKQVGKLVDIFEVKDEFGLNEGMLKVGSTINALGAASTANEGYIVEFSKRMAGIAPAADISISSIMGLGATLDSLGQTSEVSSTVFSQVIPNMFKDTATYAEMAGMKTKDFAKLLKEDSNEALIKVLEGLNGNNAGLGVMAKKLDELGLGGKRSISVLGVLANNTETLREQQALANLEFDKGTSLTQEFNLKNTNLAATLEKIGKRLRGMFINSAVTNGLKGMVGYIERWTRTPLSETLEKERLNLRSLSVRLTSSNIKHGEKVKLINELKKQYPGYLKNIDAETVSNADLRKSLKDVNDMMINKIILQKEDEGIEERNRAAAEKRMELIKQEKLLEDGIGAKQESLEIFGKEVELQGTTFEKAIQLTRALHDHYEELGWTVKTTEFDQAITEYTKLNTELKILEDSATAAAEAKEKLKTRLGISDETGNIITSSDEDPDDTTPSTYRTKDELAQEAKEKEKILIQWQQRELAIYHGGEKEYVAYLMDRKSDDQHYYDYRKGAQKEIKENALLMQKQQMDTETLNRETAYLNELNGAKGNEQEKARITKRYQLDEIEHQKANIKTSIENAKALIEKHKEDVDLDLYPEELFNAHLLQLAELEKQLALLNGETIDINIESKGDDYKPKTQARKGLILGGQTIDEEEIDELALLEEEYANKLILKQEYEDRKEEIDTNYNRKKLDKYMQLTAELNNLIGGIGKYYDQQYKTDLKKLQKANSAKIKSIDDQVQAGTMSYESGEEKKKALNETYKAEENAILKKQFDTNKKFAMVQAAINTALGVTSALAMIPPNPILAGVIAATGIVELATIGSQEFVPQAFEGGYQNVIGEQDGKSYQAKRQKQTGGYFPEPTLLVGENPEYVIPEDGLANPTIARMLPVIEDARTNGTLRDISPEALFGTATYSRQKAEGGFSQANASEDIDTPDYEENDSSIESVLISHIQATNRLSDILESGISAHFDTRAVQNISDEIEEINQIKESVRRS